MQRVGLALKKRKPTLNYAPLGPKQLEFHDSQEAITLSIGGVGSGKSHMAVAEILGSLLYGKDGRGRTALFVARTHSHAKTQLLKMIKDILSHDNVQGTPLGLIEGTDYRVNMSSPITIDLPFGSKIIIWSIEGGSSLKGQNVTYAFIDEVTDCDEQTFNDTSDRIGREINKETGRFYPGRLWAVGNPPDIGFAHWMYKRFFKDYEDNGEQNTPGSGVFCQYLSTFDNPLSEDKRAHYETIYGYSEIERQRKLMGRFVNMEGLIFNNWSSDKHTIARDQMHIGLDWIHYAGLDFGYKDPTAILRIAKDPNGKLYVYAEYYHSGRTISEHCGYLKRPNFTGERLTKVFSDTHLDTVQTYKSFGIVNLEPVKKGPGSIKSGIAVIRQLLDDQKLLIAKDCINLIKEIESYQWKQNGEPKPGHGDHAIDSLRYVCMSLATHAPLTMRSSAEVIPFKVDPRPVFAYDREGRPLYLS